MKISCAWSGVIAIVKLRLTFATPTSFHDSRGVPSPRPDGAAIGGPYLTTSVPYIPACRWPGASQKKV